MDHAESGYSWLVKPLDACEFDDRIADQRHWLLQRDDANYYHDLVGADDLDGIVSFQRVTYPEVSMVSAGARVPTERFADSSGRISAARLASTYADGATIVFNRLHKRLPKLAALCVKLGAEIGATVQVNGYLTPPSRSGFPPHWDTHDVFALQLAGRKTWTLYESPFASPLDRHPFDAARHAAGKVIEELTVETGDALYIPRGVMHAAAAGDVASLHLTLAAMRPTWADVLHRAIDLASDTDCNLRRSVPRQAAQSDLVAALKDHADRVLGIVNGADVARDLSDEVIRQNHELESVGIRRWLSPA